ncbi:MAG: [acyl-carrier-protein] S-malonyltransferase [Candidatus Dactylopiibacterium carminicum]|uniref:Malonyl CoA-acyl carrier protein transacylase n=1 Tax=Candidatus Dactylopiibacterium carminicum TaxID=857335 RepID=A0A272ESR5_9RHOO|nr:ACP S-malonyltransferase [Candidatus Dactylopiibacterium carminicum]KAF7599097.1 [acyl-carrier-protein] S-malonyltransferase [Candidatus Dactylopiibacterium carminicum]PAS93142.1 MAG: [acyl-carrier-protein] S-malonyltransferase [Candidatus Dactylopiibacterium carminicum]PAS96886.1 MAG: [acyl-carrier-protein] S-malonyltransferase [Candidatus Dactylopiibacterium carminicum]PAS99111.1 MAG: [acyl-carrier-protein] S-malonyltransferase [Candidatus Dactylopiibacterium carminicum]
MSNTLEQFAVVFPGQGSQSVGMMTSFGDDAAVRETFAEASEVLGQDLWQLVADGPVELLGQTINTQPVMLTAGIAVWRAWLARGGVRPALVAGHSLGEYAALVAAGAIEFAEAVKLVRFRAQVMQEAVPVGEGGMAAILNLAPELVIEACAEAAQGQIVAPANMNSPVQIVIAGHAAAVERAMEACKARGAKRAVSLPVSAPFHSALMKPAAERLAERLAAVTITEPEIAVLNNVDVKTETSPAAIRDALVRQAYSPVRWIESVEAMGARGIRTVCEFGPGKVLAGLVKRINGELAVEAVTDAEALLRVREQISSV